MTYLKRLEFMYRDSNLEGSIKSAGSLNHAELRTILNYENRLRWCSAATKTNKQQTRPSRGQTKPPENSANKTKYVKQVEYCISFFRRTFWSRPFKQIFLCIPSDCIPTNFRSSYVFSYTGAAHRSSESNDRSLAGNLYSIDLHFWWISYSCLFSKNKLVFEGDEPYWRSISHLHMHSVLTNESVMTDNELRKVVFPLIIIRLKTFKHLHVHSLWHVLEIDSREYGRTRMQCVPCGLNQFRSIYNKFFCDLINNNNSKLSLKKVNHW
jgi:hypothetical protein